MHPHSNPAPEAGQSAASPTNPLSPEEKARLAACEATVQRGLHAFIEVGSALQTIRDQRLYRGTHTTFEAYCREKYRIERAHAYRLIDASAIALDVSDSETPPPTKETHARALKKLPKAQRKSARKDAMATAPKGKVTEEHIERVITPNVSDSGTVLRKPVPSSPPSPPESQAGLVRDLPEGELEARYPNIRESLWEEDIETAAQAAWRELQDDPREWAGLVDPPWGHYFLDRLAEGSLRLDSTSELGELVSLLADVLSQAPS
jgi:hypothetical protein